MRRRDRRCESGEDEKIPREQEVGVCVGSLGLGELFCADILKSNF